MEAVLANDWFAEMNLGRCEHLLDLWIDDTFLHRLADRNFSRRRLGVPGFHRAHKLLPRHDCLLKAVLVRTQLTLAAILAAFDLLGQPGLLAKIAVLGVAVRPIVH